jgi:chromosome segregation ATPase
MSRGYDDHDDIRRLDQRIDEVTDETLDSTRRMVRMAEETNQIGVETLVTLNEQGEKLDNIERRLDEMNVDLKKTEKNLREMEKCCGCIPCPCGGPKSVTVRDIRN